MTVAAVLPHVVVLGTGGTIAGSSAATQETSYAAGIVAVDDLLRGVPGVANLARLDLEQVCQIDSSDMELPRQMEIAARVQAAVDRAEIDGVVVTHGTDTLEETAYLAHLLVTTDKPVVFVGAMRPSDAVSADGPANLLAAVATASSPSARGLGVLVVVGQDVHSAREVSKRHTSATDAFVSSYGPLGSVFGAQMELHARPARAYGSTSVFSLADVASLSALPPVEVVVGRAGLPETLLRAFIDSGAQGLVYVGPGASNVPTTMQEMLARAAGEGVAIVRTSRVSEGSVVRNGAVADDRLGLIAGGDLGIGKARVLLSLALTRTRDPMQIQRIFDTH